MSYCSKCVCMYKIIAKILANHLVGVIGDIVNEVQSAFIADRQILDGPFILNEDFFDEVLQKFDFGNKWCMWIQSSLRSSRGSILVNGSPTEEFQFYKGINLSPSVNLSHMFYADDAVFIGHWNDSNINTLVNVLECFYRAFGLRINMCKSKIMRFNVEGDLVKHAASKLWYLILITPFAYLRTKVGGKMSRVKEWNEVVDKVVSRLSKWKMKTLSIRGRLTLLKLVLGSITIFHMSIYRVPSKNTSLWVRVVKAIHGEDGKVEVSVLQAKGVNVMNYVRLKLGNGESTSFWEDNWINGGVLKDVFPRLYALEMCKKVYVSLKLKDSSLETSFRRKVRGCGTGAVRHLVRYG
nr:RNA-directed DNA polymerase, eukaryota [Tanacetum cinerariifolium]